MNNMINCESVVDIIKPYIITSDGNDFIVRNKNGKICFRGTEKEAYKYIKRLKGFEKFETNKSDIH